MKILALIWAWTSVDSWIPTFRWAKKDKNIDLQFFDINFIKKNKQKSITFYNKFINSFKDKKSNKYHKFLSDLDKKHKLTILSQNIDNLDIEFNNCIKLHWNINSIKCINNFKHKIKKNQKIWDKCNVCKGAIFPNILYYWEKYKEEDLINLDKIKKTNYDILLLIGTSLQIKFVSTYIQTIKADIKININPEIDIKGFINYNNLEDTINEIKYII